jgi:hypothetical protein
LIGATFTVIGHPLAFDGVGWQVSSAMFAESSAAYPGVIPRTRRALPLLGQKDRSYFDECRSPIGTLPADVRSHGMECEMSRVPRRASHDCVKARSRNPIWIARLYFLLRF